MKSVGLWFLSVAALSWESRASSSYADRTQQIFDRNNRVLESPPKSLRSRDDEMDRRVQKEKRRWLASETAEPKSDSETLEISTPPLEEVPVRAADTARRAELRAQRRESRVGDYAFSGERVFGIGFVGAGAYGIFGTEFDFAVEENLSVGFGIGTGMTYSTWGLQARKSFQGGRLNTFVQVGYANWYMGRVSERDFEVRPQYIADRFFEKKASRFVEGSRVHLAYPGLGVLFQHSSGLAAIVQIQYLLSLSDFAGALSGSAGLYFYF